MSVLGKAIRSKCMDCTCQQIVEVRECTAKNCPLHPFRMGKNPFSNRKGNPGFFKAKNTTESPNQDSEICETSSSI